MAARSPNPSPDSTRGQKPRRRHPQPARGDTLPCLRVLIVDDLVDAADGLTRLLRRLGHDVRTVYDGRAALAEEFHPDVVVLDLALPKLDGYQVAIGLRRISHLQSACLIALSGFGQEADVERGKQAGFDHHLVKPVAIDQLLELLCRRLAKRRS